MKPLVSIVTVCFNSEKTIARALESVLSQTYCNIEYIVVDGASTDGTVELAEKYSYKFADRGFSFKVISEPDNGIYDAMNKGIKMSAGEIVGMVNSDDWYEPDAVEKVAGTYERTRFDLMFAAVRIHMKNAQVLKKPKINRFFVSSRHWNHPTMFVAKAIYAQEHYACNDIYDDFDFYLRMRKQKRNIVIIPDVLANFSFGGVSNQKSFPDAVKRAKIRFRAYIKNGYSRLYIFECVLMEMAKLILA